MPILPLYHEILTGLNREGHEETDWAYLHAVRHRALLRNRPHHLLHVRACLLHTGGAQSLGFCRLHFSPWQLKLTCASRVTRTAASLLSSLSWLQQRQQCSPFCKNQSSTSARGPSALPSRSCACPTSLTPLAQALARGPPPKLDLSALAITRTLPSCKQTVLLTLAILPARYARTDELGVPFAVTVDYDSIQDGTVTLRERDTTSQVKFCFPQA